jgi:Uma2 family endonuclease
MALAMQDIQEFLAQIAKEPELQQGVTALLAAARAPMPPRRMTYAEFLAWADEDTLAEWEDMEVVMASPASYRHQNIASFLGAVTRFYVEHHHLGVICQPPFQMKLEHSGRKPDLLFIAQDHIDRLKATYLDGPADLVVEIISLESVERDRGTKFLEYETAGIPEYWLLDPLRRWLECYQLTAEGRYNPAFAGREGVYQARIIAGFWLRAEWLWQVPLPLLSDVLHEFGVI